MLATKGNVTIRKAMAILQQLLGTKATLGTSVNIANHFADQEMKAALKAFMMPSE